MTQIYNEKIPLTQIPPKELAKIRIDQALEDLLVDREFLLKSENQTLEIALPEISTHYDCNFVVMSTGKQCCF